MKDKIITILESDPNLHVTLHKLKTLLGISKKRDNTELLQVLEELEVEGKIYQDEKELWGKLPSGLLVASLNKSANLKYSFSINNSFFNIKEENLNGALNGDTVVLKKEDKEYKVVKVVKRADSQLVCEVIKDDDGNLFLKPIYTKQNINVSIGKKEMKKLVEGQRILVKVEKSIYNERYDAKLITCLGYKDEPNIELTCIAASEGFVTKFSAKVMEEANSKPTEVLKEELVGRLDLRNKNTFTIDCAQCKDMDDAVSIETLENGHTLLYVNIAHVSHYVKMNSELFKEAFNRGTSVYILNSVIPQLPQILSNGICSLNENVDRLCRSVIIEYDEFGNRLDYRIVKTVINSKKKMNYDDVNKILINHEVPEGYEPFVDDLKKMQRLSLILNQKKKDRGCLSFSSNEIDYTYDDLGNVVDAKGHVQLDAEEIIENFMLEANMCVAEEIYWKKYTFIYRNHGIPSAEKFAKTVNLFKNLGYRPYNINQIDNPLVVQKFLQTLTNKVEYPILSNLILQSMQKAYYDTENIGHFGLATGFYTHFTSPIRRLCDLMVHILLDIYEENDYEYIQKFIKEYGKFIQQVAVQASKQERAADRAEYAGDKLGGIQCLESQIGERFEVFISDITPSKIKIKMDNNFTGTIDLKSINADYTYSPDNRSITLDDINQKLLIGKKIEVTLIEASTKDLELYFSFPYLLKKQAKEERIRKRFS